MLMLAILMWGLFAGGVAWLLRGGSAGNVSLRHDLSVGVVGSYCGALIASVLTGDALRLYPVHLAGSIAGSVVLLRLWRPTPPPRRPGR